MSRSYKKYPIVTDNGCSKELKKYANRVVRQKMKDVNFGIANGKSYRKLFESYDICDYVFYLSFEQFKAIRKRRLELREIVCDEEQLKELEKEWYRMWYTSYKSK